MKEHIKIGQARLEDFLRCCAQTIDQDGDMVVVDPATKMAVEIPARLLLKLLAESRPRRDRIAARGGRRKVEAMAAVVRVHARGQIIVDAAEVEKNLRPMGLNTPPVLCEKRSTPPCA